MSKAVFKTGDFDQTLRIYPDVEAQFVVNVRDRLNQDADAFVTLNASDAPAVALAILEAAGVKASEVCSPFGLPERLERIVYDLRQRVEVHARQAAEDAEQAKLEKRRAEVAQELKAAYVPNASDSALLRAIDRIIELEDSK